VDTPPVVSPAGEAWAPDSATAVQDAVRDALATRTPIRIAGGGSWLDAGRPVASDARVLRLEAVRGITQYTPGDLTLTARAGTPLREIGDATAAEGQWLALDPFATSDDGGSIGAAIATASAGPLAHALGLPRDIALGVEVVTGDGEIIRAGGRVVKNVAGYDLTRLMTGAWGTLGILTEVSVRLRARPEVDRTLALARPGPLESAANVAAGIRTTSMAPLAAELLNPALATRLGVTATGLPVLLLRLGGNAERVASEQSDAAKLGEAAEIDTDVWRALRQCERFFPGAVVVRWSQLPSLVANTWQHAVECCAGSPEALIHASLERGVVRAIIPAADTGTLARVLRAGDRPSGDRPPGSPVFDGRRTAERLPASLWSAEAPDGVTDWLARRVRMAFDPWRLLNPGILGEGTGDSADGPGGPR
jgi:glycolate oxidase FAD binding subunit